MRRLTGKAGISGWCLRLLVLCVLASLVCSCGTLLRKREDAGILPGNLAQKPLQPRQTKEVLSTAAEGWWYGEGLGETLLSAGAVAAFPPYALVLLGNGALTLTGYEPLGVSTLLDDESRDAWQSYYGSVVSGPGRMTAALSGREFRTKEALRQRYSEILSAESPDSGAEGPQEAVKPRSKEFSGNSLPRVAE